MFPFKIRYDFLGFPLEIGPYALFFFLAIVAAICGCLWFAAKRGFDARKVASLLLIMLVSALAGARLMNALVNFSDYLAEPGKLFEIGVSGFSLYGGIMAAVASGVVYCRKAGLSVWRAGDTFVPFLGISIAIMRVGCFLQGCCFGVETDLPWGVKFPMLSPAHLYQMGLNGNFMDVHPVHPTQLYELAAALILSAAAFLLLKKKLPDGTAMLTFIAAFSAFRLVNSFLRVNPDGFSAPPFFYPAMYLLIIAACLFFIKRRNVVKSSHA